jgi:threonyl-tRNA synthetase
MRLREGLRTVVEYGEAAFYGPKLDFMVKDALGPQVAVGHHPGGLQPAGALRAGIRGQRQRQKHRPVMIHRAPFGSLERFIAVLIEHTAGRFPLWLTPEQAVVLPISDKFVDACAESRGD